MFLTWSELLWSEESHLLSLLLMMALYLRVKWGPLVRDAIEHGLSQDTSEEIHNIQVSLNLLESQGRLQRDTIHIVKQFLMVDEHSPVSPTFASR